VKYTYLLVICMASCSSLGMGEVAIRTRSGATIMVPDFINNGVTVPQEGRPGIYHLAGSRGYCPPDSACPSGAPTTDFIVTYDSARQFFTIALTNEPLGTVRKEAEQFLLTTLGINEAQLCDLHYYLGTDIELNATFAGKNLGFSFCPGSVTLA
jgi:hypothetical protein